MNEGQGLAYYVDGIKQDRQNKRFYNANGDFDFSFPYYGSDVITLKFLNIRKFTPTLIMRTKNIACLKRSHKTRPGMEDQLSI